jgi:transcriptional regulator with XRE-family HTH domain
VTGQREHGTRACYVWGPEPGQGQGCRCEPCRAANRAANNHREREIVYGRWQPFVDAGPVRQHIAALAGAGIGRRRLAELSGVSDAALRRLTRGLSGRPPSQRVRPKTAEAILAVRPVLGACAGFARVNALGTQRRLQALIAAGWTQTALAERLGMTPSNFGAMLQRPNVSADTARAVVRLYDDLWDEPPPTGTPRADAIARQARKYAERRRWAPPLAWDDDAIDDPQATPAEGWRRPKRLTSAETAAEAAELITGQGYTRQQAAERLGVSVGAIEKAFARALRATPTSTEEDGSMPMFDPAGRPANEYQRGAAFGMQMFYRQFDGGVPCERIREIQDAAKLNLLAAAGTDAEREFTDGYAAAVDTRIAILKRAEDARAELDAWEAECDQEREAV